MSLCINQNFGSSCNSNLDKIANKDILKNIAVFALSILMVASSVSLIGASSMLLLVVTGALVSAPEILPLFGMIASIALLYGAMKAISSLTFREYKIL